MTVVQLDIAIGLLRGEGEAGGGLVQEEAVHEARKAFKRLRALMRLLEDRLDPESARRERRILRDAGRQLAGARDAEVLIATLEGVLRRAPRKLGRRRAVRELREQLRDERSEARRGMLADVGARAQVVAELEGMRARVLAWRLPEHPALELVGPGLQRIYRAGGNAQGKASKPRDNARAMHRWRKHAKELRYALEAVNVQDGARDGAGEGDRGASRRIGRAAKRADELGELLGAHHDLVVLGERVRALERGRRPAGRARDARATRADRRRARKDRKARKHLLREVERRRAKLRRRALRAGAKLYERKPARFVGRLGK